MRLARRLYYFYEDINPRNVHKVESGVYTKLYTDSKKENRNKLGGKKILTKFQRYETELNKHQNLTRLGIPTPRIIKYNPELPSISFKKLNGSDLFKAYRKLDSITRKDIFYEILRYQRKMHENGIYWADPQTRNVFLMNGTGIVTDLEAQWDLPDGNVLDVMVFTADVFDLTGKKDLSILQDVAKAYGSFQKTTLENKYLFRCKLAYGVNNKFIDFFVER